MYGCAKEMTVGADAHIRPLCCCGFRVDVGIDPYKHDFRFENF